MIHAYAAHEPHGELKPFEYDPGLLGDEDVEIKVESCGICHSDLSMIDNEWGMSRYPIVPGHEVIGTIADAGSHVKHLQIGQRVGLGWYSRSCQHCEWCVAGDNNLCLTAEGTIVGRHGGFADRVRAHNAWVFPLPDGLDLLSAGPLFCGGITVFNPIVQFNVKPTDRVGVIGIGGLGHLALKFLKAWGCDVTAFTSSAGKAAEARDYGAGHIIESRDPNALKAAANSFDLILSAASADLDWGAYVAALRGKGRLHFVGVFPKPISTPVFPLIERQRSISGSPFGSPSTISKMLDFVVRHQIQPVIETFPFERVNEALARLRSGKARYRIVLQHP